MSEKICIETPLSEETVRGLQTGDRVLLSGFLYTARDAAHARMAALLNEGKPLPFDPTGQVIYYVGPTPTRPGKVIGSAGPTTSGRMDAYAPRLIAAGQRGLIGKGQVGPSVVEAMKKYGAVYFSAVGGAAALITRSILKSEIIAYEDLGTEAIRKLTVRNFPLIVAMDSHGGNLFAEGREKYRKS